jgi:hypothetical protein
MGTERVGEPAARAWGRFRRLQALNGEAVTADEARTALQCVPSSVKVIDPPLHH